ncbi:glycogen/starch synthase [Bradyrhizobium lablabi]|nr:glycogen/starch synthase [Bradyrhizobium lablabi]
MKVLFVTTEMDDFVRVGGLAAVSAALPRALRPWSDVRGHASRLSGRR